MKFLSSRQESVDSATYSMRHAWAGNLPPAPAPGRAVEFATDQTLAIILSRLRRIATSGHCHSDGVRSANRLDAGSSWTIAQGFIVRSVILIGCSHIKICRRRPCCSCGLYDYYVNLHCRGPAQYQSTRERELGGRLLSSHLPILTAWCLRQNHAGAVCRRECAGHK